jgi:hypothetical protein
LIYFFLLVAGSSLLGGNLKSSGCNVFDTEPITAMDISTKEPSFIAVAGRKSKCCQPMISTNIVLSFTMLLMDDR